MLSVCVGWLCFAQTVAGAGRQTVYHVRTVDDYKQVALTSQDWQKNTRRKSVDEGAAFGVSLSRVLELSPKHKKSPTHDRKASTSTGAGSRPHTVGSLAGLVLSMSDKRCVGRTCCTCVVRSVSRCWVGPLVRWFVGLLARWFVGSLVRWLAAFVGLLGCRLNACGLVWSCSRSSDADAMDTARTDATDVSIGDSEEIADISNSMTKYRLAVSGGQCVSPYSSVAASNPPLPLPPLAATDTTSALFFSPSPVYSRVSLVHMVPRCSRPIPCVPCRLRLGCRRSTFKSAASCGWYRARSTAWTRRTRASQHATVVVVVFTCACAHARGGIEVTVCVCVHPMQVRRST
jgi:hypothetical protein